MLQRFDTRKYSVSDLLQWEERSELVLRAKFQRRDVWSDKARSYLIDTILRGKPIPKLYMRQDTNPKTRRTVREVVDGQQRLRTVFAFVRDGFRVYKSHNEDAGGKRFSELDDETQKDILKYEFVVDLLQDMPDQEIYDVFARLNTYSVRLNDQELRHAKFFGEFRTLAYNLANEFNSFWEENCVLTSKQILRRNDAELVSDLLLQMIQGVTEKSKGALDSAYRKYDESLPRRMTLAKRFRETMDIIGSVFQGRLSESKLSGARLFPPLFASVYHMQFGLERCRFKRVRIARGDFPKVQMALERIDETIRKAEGEEELSKRERKFYKAYVQHWVHKENRNILTGHMCHLITLALRK